VMSRHARIVSLDTAIIRAIIPLVCDPRDGASQ
jgi:hypothetical protein